MCFRAFEGKILTFLLDFWSRMKNNYFGQQSHVDTMEITDSSVFESYNSNDMDMVGFFICGMMGRFGL